MPKPFCPPKGMPSSTLPNAVHTLVPPRSVLPKKSGLYEKSPSTPMTPPPIHPRLAPQFKRLASTASLNSPPASPPKFQPMNGMKSPSARAAAGERPLSSAAMMSVGQRRADSELVVMPRRVHAVCRAFGRRHYNAKYRGPVASRERLTSRPRNVVADGPLEGDPYFVVVAAAGAAGALLLCSSTTRRAR